MGEETMQFVDGKPVDSHAVVDELVQGLRETADAVVPWFLKNMPLMYFQDTDYLTQLSHLRAIIAAKASNRPLELTLRSEDGTEWTSMRPLDYPGVLAELVRDLPHDRPLRAAKIHTAMDGQLVLDTFEFGESPLYDPSDPDQATKRRQVVAYADEHQLDFTEEEIDHHLAGCRAEYVLTVTPLRLNKNRALYRQVAGTDGTAISLEPESDPSQCRITVAVGNAGQRIMFERIARRLAHSSINIHRAYLDVINDGSNGTISLLGFVIQGPDGGPIDPQSALWATVRRDLLRNKWIDNRTLELAYRHDSLDVVHAEIITGLCDLVHQVLVKQNAYAFNPDRIARIAEKNLKHTREIVRLFLDRFNPYTPLEAEDYKARRSAIEEDIAQSVDLEDARAVFSKMLQAVDSTLRTNVYIEERYGLSMRLDPSFMANDDRPEIPYGVFFVHGRDFNGFHVRFRDIARGGVRAVCPIGLEQHARESERLYDEAYGLAFAQQLKNKDIPEGGAKATVLIAPGATVSRSVKGFVDSILDLITPDAQTRSLILNRNGQEELLYFGPDENITPELIDWVVDRARRRSYPTPTALMSSKPGAGINHKEYGVTSEGVIVFLDTILRAFGYQPKQHPFTIKITGGPDGDVAGNSIRILHREYGDNARIVGIADGSGSAEDPDGLNHQELLRLVTNVLPIAHFNRDRLGPHGRVTALDEPDGVRLRNTMHNRILADAFLPCGGRPNTIHADNWRDFLLADGRPSSSLIVEGANLFLTPEARIQLSDAGVTIVKDSSANKCGVICSSYEIGACMLLSEEEFMGIKDRFVEQVLNKLRAFARREAELLVRIHRHRPQIPLPEMSTRVSRVMLRTADAIETMLRDADQGEFDLLKQLVFEHLPAVLLEHAGDRLWSHLPKPYLRWMMAKSLSTRMVYREGFEYLESMPLAAIPSLAIKYLHMELERQSLATMVDESNLDQKERIRELLNRSGILSTISET
ncbi:MAG: glutamate dehydrogenase [Phycisphaerales bacterium]|nr:MAG: glutamate dehydrogenase [Phycisphaerales bacterium]